MQDHSISAPAVAERLPPEREPATAAAADVRAAAVALSRREHRSPQAARHDTFTRMALKNTILGWLGRPPEKDEQQPEIEARPGRKSSDKEDILAADRFGMRGLGFEDDQDSPRH